jgi:hypothetical protein
MNHTKPRPDKLSEHHHDGNVHRGALSLSKGQL